MRSRKVKIFESNGFTELETQLNAWLENSGYHVESIAYSIIRGKYSILVYYQHDDEHKTEPLGNNTVKR
jgi:hypothetical protein